MQTAPLQLSNYFFPIVSVMANPDFHPDLAKGKGPPILNVEVTSTAHDEGMFEVQMDISINNTSENPSQYTVLLKAIGVFTVDPTLKDKENIVKAVGASILYSASRDFLLTIMSRGPWVPIMLNLTSFRPENTPPPEDSHAAETGRVVRKKRTQAKQKV